MAIADSRLAFEADETRSAVAQVQRVSSRRLVLTQEQIIREVWEPDRLDDTRWFATCLPNRVLDIACRPEGRAEAAANRPASVRAMH
jgi:hypothetical protein